MRQKIWQQKMTVLLRWTIIVMVLVLLLIFGGFPPVSIWRFLALISLVPATEVERQALQALGFPLLATLASLQLVAWIFLGFLFVQEVSHLLRPRTTLFHAQYTPPPAIPKTPESVSTPGEQILPKKDLAPVYLQEARTDNIVPLKQIELARSEQNSSTTMRLETAYMSLCAEIGFSKITVDLLRERAHVKRDAASRFLREQRTKTQPLRFLTFPPTGAHHLALRCEGRSLFALQSNPSATQRLTHIVEPLLPGAEESQLQALLVGDLKETDGIIALFIGSRALVVGQASTLYWKSHQHGFLEIVFNRTGELARLGKCALAQPGQDALSIPLEAGERLLLCSHLPDQEEVAQAVCEIAFEDIVPLVEAIWQISQDEQMSLLVVERQM